MERHGIEWEDKGTHDKHLSVLDYKKEQRAKEIAVLDTVKAEKESLPRTNSLSCPLITSSFSCTIFSDMVCCLLSEWCVATSFYQRSANHVSFYLLFNLRNLFYLIDE